MCAAQIAKAGLVAIDKIWDNGFRQITSSTKPINDAGGPQGLQDPRAGRRRCGPRCSRRSAPRRPSINFNEVYSALQTKIVEGQENPLALIIDRQALRGAEILLADQPHVGRLLVPRQRRAWESAAGRRARRSSPRTSTPPASNERDDIAKLNATLQRRTRRARAWCSTARRRAVPREAAVGRLLRRVEGQVRRRGLGAAGKGRRQAVVTAVQGLAWLDADGSIAAAGEVTSRSPPFASRHRSKRALGAAGRDRRRRCWCVAEIVVLFAGVVARYVFHQPADLVGRTGLDPVPVARHARRGGRVPPRRAHAHDRDRRQRRRRDAGLSRRWSRPCAALAFLLLIVWPAYEYAYDESFITTPALEISNAWRAAALPVGFGADGAVRAAAAGAGRRRQAACSARSLSVAADRARCSGWRSRGCVRSAISTW